MEFLLSRQEQTTGLWTCYRRAIRRRCLRYRPRRWRWGLWWQPRDDRVEVVEPDLSSTSSASTSRSVPTLWNSDVCLSTLDRIDDFMINAIVDDEVWSEAGKRVAKCFYAVGRRPNESDKVLSIWSLLTSHSIPNMQIVLFFIGNQRGRIICVEILMVGNRNMRKINEIFFSKSKTQWR